MKDLKVKIGPYEIKGFKIPIEQRDCFRLLKDNKVIEESYSQLGLEITLLDLILPFKGWFITAQKIFREYPFYIALKNGIPEKISLEGPDVYIYIMQRLNEI